MVNFQVFILSSILLISFQSYSSRKEEFVGTYSLLVSIFATTIFPLSCRISVPVLPDKENFTKVSTGCSAQELILMSFDFAYFLFQCSLSMWIRWISILAPRYGLQLWPQSDSVSVSATWQMSPQASFVVNSWCLFRSWRNRSLSLKNIVLIPSRCFLVTCTISNFKFIWSISSLLALCCISMHCRFLSNPSTVQCTFLRHR